VNCDGCQQPSEHLDLRFNLKDEAKYLCPKCRKKAWCPDCGRLVKILTMLQPYQWPYHKGHSACARCAR
jgi:hypothetical protein